MRRAMKAILCVLLAGALVGAGALAWVVYQEAHAGDELTKSDVLIVLGARVRPDGTLSNSLEYRMQTALAAYEAGYADYFIVCGAQGDDEPCTEASAMGEYLIKHGVPEERIFADEESFNTRQNIEQAKAIMDAQGFSTAIVVTNAYHVARAKALCRDAGIEALGAAAKMPRGFFVPWKMRVREALSWINYLIRRAVPGDNCYR